MGSSTSRKLSENRKYQRTQVTITAGSNCRFRNNAGRLDLIPSPYQIQAATLPRVLVECACSTVARDVRTRRGERQPQTRVPTVQRDEAEPAAKTTKRWERIGQVRQPYQLGRMSGGRWISSVTASRRARVCAYW